MSDQHGFDRSDRVEQLVHREVARLFLNEVNDPRLKGVEIIDVDMTPDLRLGRIYYMMIDGEPPSEDVEEALEGIEGFVKTTLGSRLEMRYVPDVEFVFDASILHGRRIDELLSDLDDGLD